MHCPCGRPIGVETTCDPPLFYDQNDLYTPVTHCPACNALITMDMLVCKNTLPYDPVVEALRVLARRGRYLREQEERELAARNVSMTAPLDEATVQSGNDEPGQTSEDTLCAPEN